jgi:hypothetical protein
LAPPPTLRQRRESRRRLLADIGLASEEIIDIRTRRPIGASLASTSGELR